MCLSRYGPSVFFGGNEIAASKETYEIFRVYRGIESWLAGQSG